VGKVATCLVSTDYGKEEYTFNEAGLLTELVTRYSDADYDVTIYKYKNAELIEKRVEQYRDKVMDRTTSIANFYTIDTVGNRNVVENVLTYEKEALEKNEYHYDADGKLSKYISANNAGITETDITYEKNEAVETVRYVSNNEILKSIKTILKNTSDTTQTKTITTKRFIEGKPNSLMVSEFNTREKLVLIKESLYDNDFEEFLISKEVKNTYTPDGMLEKSVIKKGKEVVTKDYLYQFDPQGNWIKEIIIPANTYKTRKIEYYTNTTTQEEVPE